MKLNVGEKIYTHEGARAANVGPEQQLRRSVMACLLWEDSFYEEGNSIASRIMELVPRCRPEFVAACAYHARTDMKLRYVPLLLVREMARLKTHKHLVSKLLADVIQRPDELTEFLAIYWKEKKQPLSAQVKKGLAKAFQKFNEYSFAKYQSADSPIKLRDVLFMVHARPGEKQSDELFKRIAEKSLVTPDTWEVALSAGADKKETFTRLMKNGALGALAFLRNLRNMKEAGVDKELIKFYSKGIGLERVLPFRFISAARYVPEWEDLIEAMMFRCLEGSKKLRGTTVMIVDNSGSMYGRRVSGKSEITRADAAAGLAMLTRELCEEVKILSFSDTVVVVPPRRGFALRDAIRDSTKHSSTYLDRAVFAANELKHDRIIVISDEQVFQKVPNPKSKLAYMINVSVEKNGIGYGPWTHIDGWSEAIINYIMEVEDWKANERSPQ